MQAYFSGTMMGKCQSASVSAPSSGGDEVDICLKLTSSMSGDDDDDGANRNIGLGTLSVISEDGILLNILGYVSDVPFELNAGQNSNGKISQFRRNTSKRRPR